MSIFTLMQGTTGSAATTTGQTSVSTLPASLSSLNSTAYATTSAYSGGSLSGANSAPSLFTGGALVQTVNSRYAADIANKQAGLKTATDALQAMQLTIQTEQQNLADLTPKWQAASNDVDLWNSRHNGCGPGWLGYDYSCGECDDNATAAQKIKDGLTQQMNAIKATIAEQQAQLQSQLQPQVDTASKALQNTYASYRTDIEAAQKSEAASQLALSQTDPAYLAQVAKNEAAAKASALAQSEADSKAKLQKYGIIALAVIAVAVVTVFIIRALKK